MIAVDTNLLVYAHRPSAPFHEPAQACLASLAEGRTAWAIPWPCIHEFLAVVTHPRIFMPPSPAASALEQVSAWLDSPSLVLLSESRAYWSTLAEVVRSARVAGPLIHDARIAALCRVHGVRELWTADRDFGRFAGAGLVLRNPLVPDGVAEARLTYGTRRRAGARLRRRG